MIENTDEPDWLDLMSEEDLRCEVKGLLKELELQGKRLDEAKDQLFEAITGQSRIPLFTIMSGVLGYIEMSRYFDAKKVKSGAVDLDQWLAGLRERGAKLDAAMKGDA